MTNNMKTILLQGVGKGVAEGAKYNCDYIFIIETFLNFGSAQLTFDNKSLSTGSFKFSANFQISVC